MKALKFTKKGRQAAFTLAESVVSLGIGAVAMLGGMTLSQHELRLVKSVRESNGASHALEERIEQLRLVNWKQMTDTAYLAQKYLPNAPKSARALPEFTERLTVSAYPDIRACSPLILERDARGQARIVSPGDGWKNQRLARVNVRVSWKGSDNKIRTRELASVISNAGINATSLPPMGTDSGTSTSESTTTTTTAPESGSSTTTTTGDASSGTTTTTTTTSGNGNGNGNGNGQGNVAGKSGKK